MVFLHDLQILSHLLSLLRAQGRKVGAFLGPVLRRPLGKFLRLTVMFRGIGVGLTTRIRHSASAVRKVRDLKYGSRNNNASNSSPHFLVGTQPREHFGRISDFDDSPTSFSSSRIFESLERSRIFEKGWYVCVFKDEPLTSYSKRNVARGNESRDDAKQFFRNFEK